MRFAISIPQFVSDGEFDPAGFRAYMARAEALGFESAWTLEQPLGMMPFLSPLQTMSYAAACTDRIPGLRRVRHPAAQPRPPGQGPEHTGPVELRSDRRRRWHRRTASTTKQFAEQVPIASKGRSPRRGATRRRSAIGKRVYIAGRRGHSSARAGRLGESLQRFYCRSFSRTKTWRRSQLTGPPDACVRGLREVAEAGAELILLNPVFDEAEQMERRRPKVMPKSVMRRRWRIQALLPVCFSGEEGDGGRF